MEQICNQITIRGELVSLPVYSHENHGIRFFRFELDVPRLSGISDRLPVIAQEKVLNGLNLSGGELLTVTGQIRSHNNRIDGKRRLLVFIYATDMIAEDGEFINDVTLEGHLCREPVFRRTPLGRQICDVMLAVPRPFKRADYLPCILWGRTAEQISLLHIADPIRIYGRLQSRTYTKMTESGPEERTTYEISALSAEILEDII